MDSIFNTRYLYLTDLIATSILPTDAFVFYRNTPLAEVKYERRVIEGTNMLAALGAGTVTSFSSGNLSPLFTTSVATPTTTPALSFILTNQNANLVFAGPISGVPGAPSFRALVAADFPVIPAPTLAQVLATGNLTGGNDIIMTDGDFITSADGFIRQDFGSGSTWTLTTDTGLGATGYIVIGQATASMTVPTVGSLYINGSYTELTHSTQIYISAPLVNFSQLTPNTAVYIDAINNLTSVTAGVDGQVLTQVLGIPTWVNSLGGETLAQTLVLGNTTGGTNIIIDSGDFITSPTGTIQQDFGNDLYWSVYTDGPIGLSGLIYADPNTVTMQTANGNVTTGILNTLVSHITQVTIDAPLTYISGNVGIAVTPSARLHVKGLGSSLATYTAKFENSIGLLSLQIRDDGSVYNLGGGSITTNTAFGVLSLLLNTTGTSNSAFGTQTLLVNTTGLDNTAIGASSLFNNIVGSYNTAIGVNALNNNNSDFNTAVGRSSLFSNTTGIGNTAVGNNSQQSNSTGNYNTSIGYYSGLSSVGDRNVFIGKQAGYYETGSDKLFIDNAQRASEADGRIKALIYGVFDATPANQRFTINGNVGIQGPATATSPLNITGLPLAAAGLVAGDVWNNAGVLNII